MRYSNNNSSNNNRNGRRQHTFIHASQQRKNNFHGLNKNKRKKNGPQLPSSILEQIAERKNIGTPSGAQHIQLSRKEMRKVARHAAGKAKHDAKTQFFNKNISSSHTSPISDDNDNNDDTTKSKTTTSN
jgi:hypothetical protein